MNPLKTIKIKLKPNKFQAQELARLSKEYIRQANLLIETAVADKKFPKATSKHIDAELPSVIKNELIRYAKTKFKQFGNCTFKKPTISWNNQNYSLSENSLDFPIIVDGKVKKTRFKAIIPAETFEELKSSKLGSLRISKKGFHWIAQISIETKPLVCTGIDTLGVDLGILVPAVGVVNSTGKTKFFGNGRSNKYLRRKYKELRKKLGKAKKLNAIKRINDKESRIMKDINHKISKKIVDFAVENNCGTINLENLSDIRQTSRTRGKNKQSLHSWTFYQLASFVEYKAYNLGIKIEYINPQYTSQECPVCHTRNKTNTREYKCACGYKTHRDRLGALNIAQKSNLDGKSLSA